MKIFTRLFLILLAVLAGASAQAGICGEQRNHIVEEAIVKQAGVSYCGDVTDEMLSKIERLDLNFERYNYFSTERKLPLKKADFKGLTGLKTLNFSSLIITKLPEDTFENLTALENLWFYYVGFENLPGRILSPLKTLKTFSLSHGYIDRKINGKTETVTLEVPENLFAGLVSLQEISFYFSSMEHIPEGLFRGLVNLQDLDLGVNHFTTLPSSLFAGLKSLKKLNLMVNRLQYLSRDDFKGLKKLENLTLGGNTGLSIDERAFRDLKSLKEIDLGMNKLTSIPDQIFKGLSNLRAIDLQQNAFKTLPPHLLSGINKLKWFNISINEGGDVELPKEVWEQLGKNHCTPLDNNKQYSTEYLDRYECLYFY